MENETNWSNELENEYKRINCGELISNSIILF